MRAASHRERRARLAVRSVRAELRRVVEGQAAVADAAPRHDAALAVDLVQRQAASVARVHPADGPAAAARHEAVLPEERDGPLVPEEPPADAEVRPLEPEVARLWEAQAALRAAARVVLPLARHAAVPEVSSAAAACAPVPFAVRPAPSARRLARRGQIEKRKMRRSRAIPVSDSSCPSLLLTSCVSTQSTTHVLVMCHARNGLTMVRQECGGVHRRFDYFAGNGVSSFAI